VVLLGLVAWQAQPLVVALYERGSFSAHDSVATTGALRDALWAYVLYPMSVALVRGASLAGCQRALWGSAALFLGGQGRGGRLGGPRVGAERHRGLHLHRNRGTKRCVGMRFVAAVRPRPAWHPKTGRALNRDSGHK